MTPEEANSKYIEIEFDGNYVITFLFDRCVSQKKHRKTFYREACLKLAQILMSNCLVRETSQRSELDDCIKYRCFINTHKKPVRLP